MATNAKESVLVCAPSQVTAFPSLGRVNSKLPSLEWCRVPAKGRVDFHPTKHQSNWALMPFCFTRPPCISLWGVREFSAVPSNAHSPRAVPPLPSSVFRVLPCQWPGVFQDFQFGNTARNRGQGLLTAARYTWSASWPCATGNRAIAGDAQPPGQLLRLHALCIHQFLYLVADVPFHTERLDVLLKSTVRMVLFLLKNYVSGSKIWKYHFQDWKDHLPDRNKYLRD